VTERLARQSWARALVAAEPLVAGAHHSPLGSWLHRLCTAATQAIPAEGVVVTLQTDGGLRTPAAASSPVFAALDELQSTLGDGPSLTAFESRRPVLAGDLGPLFAPAAQAAGIRGVAAFPLQVGAARLGCLTAYRSDPGAWPETAVTAALVFADIAVEALLDRQALVDHGAHVVDAAADPVGLDGDVGYVVYQAQGMVMVDLGIPLPDAMARLKAHAFAVDRPLSDVARDIVEKRLTLDQA
jgi:hypothetical protein